MSKRKQDRKPPDNKGQTASTTSIERAITAAVAAFLLLRLAGAFLIDGPSRTWGFDYARYLAGEWDVVAALLLPFVALMPAVRRTFVGLFPEKGIAASSSRKTFLAAVAAAASVAFLVYLFRVPFAFLGDGAYYAGEMYRLISLPDHSPAFIKPTSWLTGHVLSLLGLWLQPADATLPFVILGAAASAFLTASLFAFLGKGSRGVSVLMATVAFTGAGSLLFFGYIELYALTYAFSIAYFLATWAAFRRGSSVITPGLLLLFAAASGLAALFFLPSYLLLLHWKFRGEGGPINLKAAAAVLAALTVAGLLAGYALLGFSVPDGELIPLYVGGNTRDAFTMFSPARLLDLFNVLVLNAGVWIFVLAAVSAFGLRLIGRQEPLMLFAALAALGGFAFLFTGNTVLGLARDWDLAAAPAYAISFLGLAAIITLHEKGALRLAHVAPLILLAAASSAYTWLRVNLESSAQDSASARRIYDIAVLDHDHILPVHAYTAFDNLRQYRRSVKDASAELVLLHRMAETRHLIRDTYDKLITSTGEIRDAVERRAGFKQLLDMLRGELTGGARDWNGGRAALDETVARAILATLQFGHTDIAATAFTGYREQAGRWKEAPLIEAFLLPGLSTADKAARAVVSVDSATRDAALLAAAARIHAEAGNAARAAATYELAIAREPGRYPSLYLELSRIYYEILADQDRSMATLNRCIREARGTPEAQEAQRIIGKMQAIH